MQIGICVFLFTLGVLLLEARSIDSTNSVQVMLNILLGRSGRQGGGIVEGGSGRQGGEIVEGGDTRTEGDVEERIRSTLEALQQHVAQLAANMSSLERIDGTLQRIQDMAEDTNTVQENILEYLGIEDEIPSRTDRPPTESVFPADCPNDEFACDNGNCIREGWRCDGDNDCGDGSDEAEQLCRPSCTYGQFQCEDGSCINEDYICDGDSDCRDSSDEAEYICPHLYTLPPTPPPVLSGVEHLYLNHINTSVTIRHPINGGSYYANEQFDWIVTSDDPEAVGFRVEGESVSVEDCCDMIIIPREECHFDTRIRTASETPVFIPGSLLNLTFRSDSSVNYDGFTFNVLLVYDMDESICPGNEEQLVLHENKTTLLIQHPENGNNYENNEEYIWMIRNEDPEAVGFEVTIDKLDVESCCDRLRVEGSYCNYGRASTHAESKLTIRGDSLNITWKSDSSSTYSGFIVEISTLYELNKTECYNYTCDASGRCVRAHYDDRGTWNESKAACEAEGARLAVIPDLEMEQLVRSVYNSDMGAGWIGLSGTYENPTWITGLSTDDYGYQNFDSIRDLDEPNCVYYYTDGWVFENCEIRKYYICEKVQ